MVWNCRGPSVAIATTGACASSNSTAAWHMRIAAVKSAILSKLGISLLAATALSDSVQGIDASPALLAAYHAAVISSQRGAMSNDKMCEGESESLFAKTILFYTPVTYSLSLPASNALQWGSTAQLRPILPEAYRLKFKLNVPQHSFVAYSQLRLYKKSVLTDVMFKTDSVGVEVYIIPPLDNSARAKQQTVTPKLVCSRMIDTTADKIESFDVTSAVQQYASSGQQLQILDMQVVIKTPVSMTSGLSFPPPVKFVMESAQGGNSTQLIVALLRRDEVSGTNTRRRRSAGVNSTYCVSNLNERNCCLKPLEINFSKDLGWNWIISPKSYKANYCQGLCPSYWPAATTATSFLISYRQSNPTAAVQPCCGTAVLKPLTVLGVTNGAPFLVELPDMIVDSCVCR
ncbi:hypothetical protein EMCRGX_G032640 [Ephydatia muelleri]